jgi:hypothetical protein
MANLSTRQARKAASSPVTSTGKTKTFEGGIAFTRTSKSDLFVLGTLNFHGEDTFYETGDARAQRFRGLIRTVTKEDPQWVADFLRWLRHEGNIRTASIVGAVEYAQALREMGNTAAPSIRTVINSVIVRGDEPAEAIAYVKSAGYGLAGGLQRGIADAALRLYDERNALKYDGGTRAWRMGDVVDQVHPDGGDSWQSDLFKYLLDRRHNRPDIQIPESLSILRARAELESVPVAQRRALLDLPNFASRLTEAGANWEWLSGWLADGKGMDRDAWESMIPSMGYMALLRNLRNFDEAGVSDKVAKAVGEKLADPEQVAKSRQFPFRFLSAYKAAPSTRWSWPLEQALDAACANIPQFRGETVIFIDTSASMGAHLSARSQVALWEAGALFGIALARRNEGHVKVVNFASGSEEFTLKKGESVLPALKRFSARCGAVGHGTETGEAIRRNFTGQDRVVIFTDLQSFPVNGRTYGYYQTDISSLVPAQVPMYAFNLAGYAQGDLDTSQPNRHEFAGFTDNAFKMIPLLEAGKSQSWPWMNK